MAEKLSQGQIDALLKRINSGDKTVELDNEKQIREYDFKSPKKFTKEQLKTLDGLHENFSRLLSSYFSGLLRMFCEVSVLQIEEQRYYEYSNALPDNALIGMINLKPANKQYNEATLIMDMSTTIGFFMIDRLLGGSGEGYNLNRDYSDIEIEILKNVFHKICRHLQEAWCSYIEVETNLTSMETNSRLLQALAPDDIVVIVALNMKIKNLNGGLSLCIPAANLEEMIGNFSVKYARTFKRQDPEQEEAKRKMIFERLTDSDLEVKAVLDQFQLNLSDVMNLQLADVIPLSKSINSDIDIVIDDIPWYSAKLGKVKMKKAVKLNELIS